LGIQFYRWLCAEKQAFQESPEEHKVPNQEDYTLIQGYLPPTSYRRAQWILKRVAWPLQIDRDANSAPRSGHLDTPEAALPFNEVLDQ